MRSDFLRRPIPRRGIMYAVVLTSTACASAPTAGPTPYQVGTSVSAPPRMASIPPGPVVPRGPSEDAPPSMASAPPSIVGTPSARITVAANNEDLPVVLERVARQVGLTPVIDPAVRGSVTRSLRNVSLGDAMLSLVGSQYQYQVRGGTLVVTPVQLIQHTYTVDYLAMSRISSGSTVVSRGTQGATSNTSFIAGASGTGTGVSSSGSGLVASGADVIQSSSQADVWGELTQQLQSIIFNGTTDSARAVTSSGSGGARSFERCEGRVCLRISPLTSLVDVTASPEKQEEVARYIGLFTAAITRQVSIKAQVVEVGLDRRHTFGIDWNAVLTTAKRSGSLSNSPAAFSTDPESQVSGNATFNLGFGSFTIQAVLNALQSVGDVSVVATPSTNAMNQQKASFNVTRQQQFISITRTPIISPTTGAPTGQFNETTNIQSATVGLVFDVLPQISDKNIVMMAIRPSVTSLVTTEEVAGANGAIQATLPVIDHRETDTMARVRSGETIMIGGLIQKQSTSNRSGVPILMDLPILGRLFSKTTVTERTSELVIFLTPEIISGQPPVGR